MTTITLEVPDELAAQFKIEPAQLPALIREAVESRLSKPTPAMASPETPPFLHQEVIDFFASNPPLEQIAEFKISAPTQERLDDLLDKNREEGLTPEEKSQVEQYTHYRHIMILLKAGARRVLKQQAN